MKLRAFDVCFRAVQRGYSLDEVRPCLTKNLGGGWFDVDTSHDAYPAAARAGYTPPPGVSSAASAMLAELGVTDETLPRPGPGSELHSLLRRLGIEPTPNCSCRSMARKMDLRGPDWCESDEGMAEILGVMRTEHGKRWYEGRTILPWTDMGARQLVLLACRRARAEGNQAENVG